MNGTILKISIRNLIKNKTFSAISIIGLSLGFTAFIIISLYIRYEFNWDTSNIKYDRIYRVQRYFPKSSHVVGGNNISPHSSPITASLLEEFPEFEKVTVIRENLGKYLSVNPDQQFYDETSISADYNYFDVFTYNFIEGTQLDALTEPFSIVLSKTMAAKLFEGKQALGQTIFLEKKYNLKVTGVYSDLPMNSTIRPAYIISFSTLKRTNNISRNSWSGDCMTFALVRPETDIKSTESKIKTLTAKFHNEELVEHQLCSLSKLHLSFNGQRDYYIILYFFGLIGLFILIMSAFNYINFIIANASNRGKEVAVRKISGVTQFSLITQFLSETLVLSLISALLAFGVVKLILPLYNTIVNTDITIEVMRDWKTLLALILVSLSIGLLSGIYPALYMSSHKIVKLFKEGMFNSRNGQINLQKALITIQFTISIFLVCLNLFFMAQINYMINKDLGFSKDNLLFTKINLTKTDGNFEDLRNRLLQNPEIINASLSSNLPFAGLSGGTTNWEGAAQDERLQYRPNRVSYNFIENMGMTIVQGRDFSNDYTADINKSCLINETALKCFGWDDPLGKRINNNQWTVVGVVKDFHFTNMHNRIEPAVMILSSGELSGELIFAFRYKAGSRNRVKEILINELNSTFPNDPYEFHEMESAFLMEPVINLYNTIKKSILFFTVFNILLAIIGLLGMVSYNTNKRIKELGIRKINGSSVVNIFYLLNRDFFIMLAISLLLAVPSAFVAFEALPGNYKMKPQLWVPIFSAFIILLIILITTSYQTIRAARRNPVEALRYE